jgi:hypothetical protein
MEGKYKVEEFESDFLGNLENLKKYLNEKASQGWSCISVTTITSLGWTLSVVWETPDALPAEKKDDIFGRDEPVKNNTDICEKKVLENNSDNEKEGSSMKQFTTKNSNISWKYVLWVVLMFLLFHAFFEMLRQIPV